jgi:hypothetical protein
MRKKDLMIQSDIIAGLLGQVPKAICTEVLPSLRTDEKGLVAKNDALILALGEAWFRK